MTININHCRMLCVSASYYDTEKNGDLGSSINRINYSNKPVVVIGHDLLSRMELKGRISEAIFVIFKYLSKVWWNA